MSKSRILIVNEDPAAMETQYHYLSMNGYDVDCLNDTTLIQEQIEECQPSFVIMKLDCAAMRGLELLFDKQLLKNLPVIVIADFDSTYDLGPFILRCGAVCYLAHMPTPEFLLAQLYAILAYQEQIKAPTTDTPTSRIKDSTLTCGRLRLDQRAYQVFVGEKPINLQPLQFKLLAFLMLNARQRFTRPHLLEAVWNNNSIEEKAVTKCVSGIRAKLPEIRDLIRCIGGGYIFEEQVQRV